MVKHFRFFAFLLATALLACSACKKDNPEGAANSDPFTLSTKQYGGNGSKSYMNPARNHEFSCWANGDKVRINGEEKSISVTNETLSNKVTVDGNNISPVNGYFVAAFPSTGATISGTTVSIPISATTPYETITDEVGLGKQSINAPMVARSDSHELEFVNICALTKFSIKTNATGNVKLLSLTISSDKPINGTLNATYNGTNWNLKIVGTTGNSRTLDFGEGLSLTTTAVPLYIAIPALDGACVFTVTADISIDGVQKRYSKAKSGAVSLKKGILYDFGILTFDIAQGQLSDNEANKYDQEPEGSAAHPYVIINDTDWYHWMTQYGGESGKHFVLNADISVSQSINLFKGSLNGNNHTITLTNCALFKEVNSATIENLTTAGSIEANFTTLDNQYSNLYFVGAIACTTYNGSITNCNNIANITLTNSTTFNYSHYIGGLFGKCSGKLSTINNCHNSGNITITNESSSYVGGIAGMANNSVKFINCSNNANIDASCNAGGIVGQLSWENTIANSYVYADITAPNCSGICYSIVQKSSISNCYFWGTLTGSKKYGICDNSNNGQLSYCYCKYGYVTAIGSNTNYCNTLTNQTTITGGANLANTLNANINTLQLTGARRWTESNGIVTFH